MTERMDTEEFAARVAAPLKQEVALSDGFDARVLRAIDALSQPWWRRRFTLQVNPIGGLALAAGFGALMALGGIGYARTFTTPVPIVTESADTVHIVRFVLADANAQQVALVGDFNGWSRDATPLVRTDGDGQWVVEVVLAPGRHEYAFLIDGTQWTADPLATTQRDEFGQESSVVRVGDALRGA